MTQKPRTFDSMDLSRQESFGTNNNGASRFRQYGQVLNCVRRIISPPTLTVLSESLPFSNDSPANNLMTRSLCVPKCNCVIVDKDRLDEAEVILIPSMTQLFCHKPNSPSQGSQWHSLSKPHKLSNTRRPANISNTVSQPRPDLHTTIQGGLHGSSPPMPLPTASELIFSEQANHNFSRTLGELKRSTLSIQNRLQSIQHDAAFAQQVIDAYGRPLVANERCGSWYIDPETKGGSAYFKSTDGHTGVWKFSARRLNLHLLEIIGKHDGYMAFSGRGGLS
jgi:Rit1 N-terminal domain